MSYSVVQSAKNPIYDIIEKNTETKIELSYNEKDARQVCRKLNLGGGFNGFTPIFFAVKFKNGRKIA